MDFHYKYYLSIRNENKEELYYKYIGELCYSNKFSMKSFSYSKKLYKLYNYEQDEKESYGKEKFKVLDTKTFSEMTFILLEKPVTLQEEEAYYDTYYTLQWANNIIYKQKNENVHFVLVEKLVEY